MLLPPIRTGAPAKATVSWPSTTGNAAVPPGRSSGSRAAAHTYSGATTPSGTRPGCGSPGHREVAVAGRARVQAQGVVRDRARGPQPKQVGNGWPSAQPAGSAAAPRSLEADGGRCGQLRGGHPPRGDHELAAGRELDLAALRPRATRERRRRAARDAAGSPRPPRRAPDRRGPPRSPALVAAVPRVGRPVEARIDDDPSMRLLPPASCPILPAPWRATGTTSSSSAADARAAPAEAEREERRRGFFRRMRENMRKTREALRPRSRRRCSRATSTRRPGSAWRRRYLRRRRRADDRAGRRAARARGRGGRPRRRRGADRPAGRAARRDRPHRRRHIDLRPDPTVILVVGVNGTGKTTSIGKLAWHLRKKLGRSRHRRGGHVPRRRRRAARALGRARRRRLVKGAGGLGPRRRRLRRLAAAASAAPTW